MCQANATVKCLSIQQCQSLWEYSFRQRGAVPERSFLDFPQGVGQYNLFQTGTAPKRIITNFDQALWQDYTGQSPTSGESTAFYFSNAHRNHEIAALTEILEKNTSLYAQVVVFFTLFHIVHAPISTIHYIQVSQLIATQHLL